MNEPVVAYDIKIHPDARAELARLERRFQRQIDRKIMSLAANPRPPKARQLKGRALRGLWRLQSGDYRIIYQIQEAIVLVLILLVGDRKSIYRNLERLIGRARAPGGFDRKG